MPIDDARRWRSSTGTWIGPWATKPIFIAVTPVRSPRGSWRGAPERRRARSARTHRAHRGDPAGPAGRRRPWRRGPGLVRPGGWRWRPGGRCASRRRSARRGMTRIGVPCWSAVRMEPIPAWATMAVASRQCWSNSVAERRRDHLRARGRRSRVADLRDQVVAPGCLGPRIGGPDQAVERHLGADRDEDHRRLRGLTAPHRDSRARPARPRSPIG